MKPYDLKREGIRQIYLAEPNFGADSARTVLIGVTVCCQDQEGTLLRSESLDLSSLQPPRTWEFMQSIVQGLNRSLDELYGD